MPPHCYVCGLDSAGVAGSVREHLTLVHFGATEDAKMADSRSMAALGIRATPSGSATST